MANKSKNEKIKIKDLFKAAKRNVNTASKKTMFWMLGIGISVVVLLVVWICDLVNIFA